MNNYLDGDLIKLAKRGLFDVIVHGCNCFCRMGAGIAPQMAEAFDCDEFEKEIIAYTNNLGDINKLGTIDWEHQYLRFKHPLAKDGLAVPMRHKPIGHSDVKDIFIVNAYTQYRYGRSYKDGDFAPFDYEAFTLCMRKINKVFQGKHIGMPKIGAGLAGGDWNRIEKIIQKELTDCKVTIVNYNP